MVQVVAENYFDSFLVSAVRIADHRSRVYGSRQGSEVEDHGEGHGEGQAQSDSGSAEARYLEKGALPEHRRSSEAVAAVVKLLRRRPSPSLCRSLSGLSTETRSCEGGQAREVDGNGLALARMAPGHDVGGRSGSPRAAAAAAAAVAGGCEDEVDDREREADRAGADAGRDQDPGEEDVAMGWDAAGPSKSDCCWACRGAAASVQVARGPC